VTAGTWFWRQRRSAESRVPLRAAAETFEALGAVPWRDRAWQDLRASGATLRRRDDPSVERLTAQGLQIAQLAAEDFTNREIGGRLFLSHRTVSTHLYRIHPKLGLNFRAQLRDVPADLGAKGND